MNNLPSEHSGSSSTSVVTPALLADARNGDPAALSRLCQRIKSELAGIARAVQGRNGGSPDGGINGASDLAQSVAAQILAKPGVELAEVFTIEQLRARLYQLLHEKWIEQRRKACAVKRGSGKVRAASQFGAPQDSSPLHHVANPDAPSPMTELEVADEVGRLLDVFDPGSQRQRILLLTLAGLTQQEIADLLGLSRDAVGRRVRESIVPTLRSKFANPDEHASKDETSP